MTNAAVLTGYSPSTTAPLWSQRMRFETVIWLKWTPNGFTQNVSVTSGSRAVMWPAPPSSKPNFENSLNPAASRCLRCSRSSARFANFGGIGNFPIPGAGLAGAFVSLAWTFIVAPPELRLPKHRAEHRVRQHDNGVRLIGSVASASRGAIFDPVFNNFSHLRRH